MRILAIALVCVNLVMAIWSTIVMAQLVPTMVGPQILVTAAFLGAVLIALSASPASKVLAWTGILFSVAWGIRGIANLVVTIATGEPPMAEAAPFALLSVSAAAVSAVVLYSRRRAYVAANALVTELPASS